MIKALVLVLWMAVGVALVILSLAHSSHDDNALSTTTSAASHYYFSRQLRNRSGKKTTNDNVQAASAPSCPKARYRILSRHTLRYLHPGKAGGGTFNDRSNNAWGYSLTQCHPIPCAGHAFEKNRTQIVLASIRDPIDRFVSAFQWRTQVVCNPAGDPRKHVGGFGGGDTQKVCKVVPEEGFLFTKYKQDVNQFAEALCTDEAKEEIHKVMHMQYALVDWFGGGQWKNKVDTLVPIVMEKGFDFNQDIDRAWEWVQEHYPLEPASQFEERKQAVDCVGQKKGNPLSMHTGGNHTSLSPQGIQCVFHHFKSDYKLIQQLLEFKVCKWKSCELALQSILDRRQHLLAFSE